MVQLAGAAPPATGGQLTAAVALGSRAASATVQRARSKAASGTAVHCAPPPTVPMHTALGLALVGLLVRSVLVAAWSAASVEAMLGGAPDAATVTLSGGVVPQYWRFECMAAARLAASMAASARRREVVVFESDSAWSLAIPSSPTQITMSDTMTSMRLKPRARVLAHRALMSRFPRDC